MAAVRVGRGERRDWRVADRTVDANAFSSYLSTYNALRVAKGYVWAGALLWLMRRDVADGRRVVPPLRLGLALGLLAATISVFWERVLFVGSYDPGAVFRASGFVSASHVGGAYLEAMLVMLAPFGLALAVTADRWLYRLMWYVVVLFGALAVLMTLSRAAVVAWLIASRLFAAGVVVEIRGVARGLPARRDANGKPAARFSRCSPSRCSRPMPPNWASGSPRPPPTSRCASPIGRSPST